MLHSASRYHAAHFMLEHGKTISVIARVLQPGAADCFSLAMRRPLAYLTTARNRTRQSGMMP